MTQREMFQDMTESMKKFGIHLAYGEKVELEGSTIIPVAAVGFGGGAGAGEGNVSSAKSLADGAQGGQGEGAGLGGGAFPVGAYVTDEFGTRFQPNIVALQLAAFPLALTAAWGLPRIIKAIKR